MISTSASHEDTLDRGLDDAVEKAAGWLWSKQAKDGAWNVVADMVPACTSQVTVALGWAGALRDDDKAEVARWLRAQQRNDGSFLPYPYARGGTASATACAWAALRVCGAGERDESVVRAAHFVYAHGGLEPIEKALFGGELTALYLALAGLLPASRLPRLPIGWTAIDALTEAIVRVVHGGVPFAALQLGVIVRAVRGDWGADFSARSAADQRACEKLLTWIDVWHDSERIIPD